MPAKGKTHVSSRNGVIREGKESRMNEKKKRKKESK